MISLEHIACTSAAFLLRLVLDLAFAKFSLQTSIAPGLLVGFSVLSILLIGSIITGISSVAFWLAGLVGFFLYIPALALLGMFLVWWNPEKYKERSTKRQRRSSRFVEDK